MNDAEQHQRIAVDFEGQFLGFVCLDGKLKYVRLRVLSEEMQIKLPKSAWLALGGGLQGGALIQVMGIGKFDRQTHEFKLKASQVIPCLERSSHATEPEPAGVVSPDSSNVKGVRPSPKLKGPKLKVLLCQKSGCLKRGGKGLGESLAQILRDRGLDQQVTIERTGCLKHCSGAPNVVVMPGNHRYPGACRETLPQVADAIAKTLAKQKG